VKSVVWIGFHSKSENPKFVQEGLSIMVILYYTLATLFVVICVFMLLLILVQKGRGGGLASAFGGAGGNTAFGSKTGDVLTWATSVVFGIFIVLAVLLNLVANQIGKPVAHGSTLTPAQHSPTPTNNTPTSPF
jgi:preprotein translocase subunit SecG